MYIERGLIAEARRILAFALVTSVISFAASSGDPPPDLTPGNQYTLTASIENLVPVAGQNCNGSETSASSICLAPAGSQFRVRDVRHTEGTDLDEDEISIVFLAVADSRPAGDCNGGPSAGANDAKCANLRNRIIAEHYLYKVKRKDLIPHIVAVKS